MDHKNVLRELSHISTIWIQLNVKHLNILDVVEMEIALNHLNSVKDNVVDLRELVSYLVNILK